MFFVNVYDSGDGVYPFSKKQAFLFSEKGICIFYKTGGNNMFNYPDPTANAAIGNLDRELRALRKEVAKIKALRQKGQLTTAQKEAAKKRFSGIYQNLLQEELGE